MRIFPEAPVATIRAPERRLAEHEKLVEVDGALLPREALDRASDIIYDWAEGGSLDRDAEAIAIYRIIRDALAAESLNRGQSAEKGSLPAITPEMIRLAQKVSWHGHSEMALIFGSDLAEEVLAAVATQADGDDKKAQCHQPSE